MMIVVASVCFGIGKIRNGRVVAVLVEIVIVLTVLAVVVVVVSQLKPLNLTPQQHSH